MSIEKLKKVLILSDVSQKEEVLESLYDLGIFHIESVRSEILEGIDSLKPLIPEKVYDEELNKIDSAFSIFKEFGLGKQGFIKGFLPQDYEVSEESFNDIVHNFPLDDFVKKLSDLKNSYDKILEEEAKLQEDKKSLMVFQGFPFQFSILQGTSRTYAIIGEIKKKNLEKFKNDEVLNNFYVNVFYTDKNVARVFILYVKEDKELLEKVIKDYGIAKITFNNRFTGFFEEEVQRIEKRLLELESNKEIILAKIKEYFEENDKLIVLRDYFQSLTNKGKDITKCLKGKTFVVIKGFAKEKDFNVLIDRISKFTDLIFEVQIEDSDFVPVSLNNPLIFKPFEFLVKLFGLPSYSNIDPSPIVAILFSVFFGFAFGDAGYGLVLFLFSLLFLIKYKSNGGAARFFSILLYGSISSIIVGVLTNSYFGDLLPSYFPNFALTKFLSKLSVINPTSPDGSVKFMILSVIIGFISQMIGVLISFIVKLKSKSYLDAIFNSLGWLLFLPGIILFFFKSTFPNLAIVANVMVIVGVLFILIGGWMSIRSPLFKPVAALVNLYGIRSSYGISGFLGDTLSYLRLFALGLSSGILASSFNLMSKVIGNILGPAGIIVTIILLFALHSLAFFMNILGAFIHSMRLNFLEFFGRFYDLGGYEFKPFGFEFKNIRIRKSQGGK